MAMITRSEDEQPETAHATIHVRGPASESFLQGQITQDVTRVTDAAWSLVLAPDSVVVTSCFVTRRDDGFDLVVPASLGEAALARLRRFHLRVDCTLALEPGGSAPLATWGERVAAGWPGEAEFRAGVTPHTFGRSFVAATMAFDKGCFTGQELVGRLDARGASVPWRLVRVSGPSVERIDEVLRSSGPDGPQGATSVRASKGGAEGLGLAHRTLLGREHPEVTVSAVD